jgi:hypothetical protein
MHELAPSYLSDLFLKCNEIHDLNTKNKEDLNIPPYKTTARQKTFHYRAVKIWNSIDMQRREEITLKNTSSPLTV